MLFLYHIQPGHWAYSLIGYLGRKKGTHIVAYARFQFEDSQLQPVFRDSNTFNDHTEALDHVYDRYTMFLDNYVLGTQAENELRDGIGMLGGLRLYDHTGLYVEWETTQDSRGFRPSTTFPRLEWRAPFDWHGRIKDSETLAVQLGRMGGSEGFPSLPHMQMNLLAEIEAQQTTDEDLDRMYQNVKLARKLRAEDGKPKFKFRR